MDTANTHVATAQIGKVTVPLLTTKNYLAWRDLWMIYFTRKGVKKHFTNVRITNFSELPRDITDGDKDVLLDIHTSMMTSIQELVDTHGAIDTIVLLEDGTGVPTGEYHQWVAFDGSTTLAAKLHIAYDRGP